MDVHNQKGTVTDLEGQFTLVVNENTKNWRSHSSVTRLQA